MNANKIDVMCCDCGWGFGQTSIFVEDGVIKHVDFLCSKCGLCTRHEAGETILEPQPSRHCNECGTPMSEGFHVDGFLEKDEYFCDETCLHRHYTKKEYNALYEDESARWTTWSD